VIDINVWLKEAKSEADAKGCGMYLIHNGVVRDTAKRQVREGIESAQIKAMDFSYDQEKLDAALARAKAMDGIKYVKAWLNTGHLNAGDDIMYIIVGGDIRPRVIECLESLLSEIKNECVIEKEIE